jgi:plasmid stabilization system protein ParE
VPVDVHPDATAEVRTARRRLELARPGYGRRFNEAFLTALRRLDETPHFFPPEEHAPAGLEVRYVELARYNYRVVYVVLGELKLVVAVTHNSQDPGYWTDRLPPA